MKNALLLFILIACAPTMVCAQGAPAPGPMGSHHHLSQADRDQMMALHKQTRMAVINALTPAHKALLSSIVGGLAVSANPDHQAAAAKLDAALSSAEKQQIIAAVTSMHEKMRAMMPTPGPSMSPRPHPKHSMRPLDAGEILLMMSGGMHGGMMMHGKPH